MKRSVYAWEGRCGTNVPAWINYQNMVRQHLRMENRRLVVVGEPFEGSVDVEVDDVVSMRE